jgi:hypothetical protein
MKTMNRFFLLYLLGVILIGSTGWATKVYPSISVSPNVFDAGILTLNQKITANYIVVNPLDRTVNIRYIYTPCTCFYETPGKGVVPPQGTLKLPIIFLNPNDAEGHNHDELALYINAPLSVKVTFDFIVTVMPK